MKFLSGLLFLTLAFTFPSGASGLIVVHDDAFWRGPNEPTHPRHPHPRPPGRPPYRPDPVPPQTRPLETRRTDIDTRIRGPHATTRIEQSFYNPNSRTLEGTFLFPVPRGAHLDQFTLEIDGHPVEAELLAADKARSVYETIVRQMKDPALLEYAGRDLFKVRIFPLEPRATRVITLSYTEILKADNGLTCYRLPLRIAGQDSALIQQFSLKIRVETDSPLTTLYSPTHSVDIKRHGEARAEMTLRAEPFQPDSDFDFYFGSRDGRVGLNLLTHRTGSGDGYFVLLASPGPSRGKAMPKDVVFVLDTSGSMSGKKMEQARKALSFCVDNLHAEDRFDILRFATDVEPLFESLTPVSDRTREEAQTFVKNLRAVGGTAIHDALNRALDRKPVDSKRPFVVIFLTDGRPTIGDTREESIVSAVTDRRQGLTRVFCFGIGNDVNTHLLDRITESTQAASQYVRPEEDLELKVSGFFTKINEPVLSGVELQFPKGVRVTQLHPNPLPDLFQGDQLVVAGRNQGSGSGVIRLTGQVNGNIEEHAFDAAFGERSEDHAFIPRLWATRRVGYLLDEIRLRGESGELKEEVTRLARHYGIVTPYTAYLISEDEKRRGVAQERRLLTPRFYDANVSRRLSDQYEQLGKSRSGAVAVDGAKALQALKSASASSRALAEGNAEASRSYSSMVAGQANDPAPAPVSQATRHVTGRAFYFSEGRWTDSLALQGETKEAKPTRIEFGSEAYFALLHEHPEVAAILSLGEHIDFVLEGKRYEIRSATID